MSISPAANVTASRLYPKLLTIALAYVAFVSLGLPDAIVGIAWPTVRQRFLLTQESVGLVFLASGLGYFLTSFFSGRLIHHFGIGLLLAGSTGLVAMAMFGFAAAPLWGLFVSFALVHGLGSGAIDAGLNGYAAHYLSARHMNWLHACYCLGAMLGPLLMTAVLTSGSPYGTGYTIVGLVMLTLSLVFLATWSQWGRIAARVEAAPSSIGTLAAFRHPAVLLQMAVFFVYTGLEVALSQWAFTVLTESRGMSTELAGIAVGVYWGSIGLGRVFFGVAVERFDIDRLLRVCLFAAIIGALLFAATRTPAAQFAGMAVAGLGLAPVFPCLMTRTPARLGEALSRHAVGFQVGAAMIGAAVIPAALGLVAGRIGLPTLPFALTALAALLFILHEGLLRRPPLATTSPST